MTTIEKTSPFEPLLECRLLAYDVLRRTFLEEPSLDFLAQIKDEKMGDLFPLSCDSLHIRRGIALIDQYISHNDLTCEIIHNDLHWDYTRLFIGPYELPTPPWESAYLNEERLLFQEETLKVRRKYLKYAFLPKDVGHEADDHLGLELDFMFQLTHLSLSELKNKDYRKYLQLLHDQKSFLEEHLLKWVPELSDKIVECAQTDFYRGMALILKGFLLLDLKALEELLDIPS